MIHSQYFSVSPDEGPFPNHLFGVLHLHRIEAGSPSRLGLGDPLNIQQDRKTAQLSVLHGNL